MKSLQILTLHNTEKKNYIFEIINFFFFFPAETQYK